MAETLVELVAKIMTDATGLKQGLDKATDGVQSWVKQNEKQFKVVGAALTGVGAAITGALGLMTKAAIDEEVNIKRLGVALQGVGVNYNDVKESLEGVILATQRKTGIADDEQRDVLGRLILVTKDYNKALSLLPLALDLAAAGQMDASTAATYLAKAYEDLEGGAEEISIRLGRATVNFKNLNEVQKLVGGTAEATANPLNVLKASMGDMAEKIGSFLIPILKDVVAKVVPIIEKIQAWTDAHPELTRVLIILAAVLGGVALVLGPILIMLPFLVASIGLLLGPIGLVVAAIMGLIAIGTLLILNWETVKTKTTEIWDNIVNFLKGVWDNIIGFFKDNWDKILAILFPAVGLPILIARNWRAITKIVSDIWDNVVGGIKSAWNSIVNFILDGVNWLIDRVNSVITLINKIPGVNIGAMGNVEIPKLAHGGIVTQPTLAMVGESGAEAIIPLNKTEGIGGITINFTQPVFFDREDTMNKFVDMIRKGIQRQDRLRFGGAYSG